MPRTDAEPIKLNGLPLFPLESVLFPDGVLPLRIFEVRYLDMIRKCHEVGTPFGVIRLITGREVTAAGVDEAFDVVGTLASIESLTTIQPGLLSVRCEAQQRFRIVKSERSRFGLWIADVERIDADMRVKIPDELNPVASSLVTVNAQLKARGLPGLPEPEHFDDCGWVANRWAEMLPIQSELKQQLMQLESPMLRLELVSDVLDKLGVLPG